MITIFVIPALNSLASTDIQILQELFEKETLRHETVVGNGVIYIFEKKGEK